MDEVPTRKFAEAHAKAVVDGDMESVTNDFIPDLRGQVPDIAKQLPQPVENAEVKKVDVEDDHANVVIEYSNETQSLRDPHALGRSRRAPDDRGRRARRRLIRR